MKLITVTLPEFVLQHVRDYCEKESTDAYERAIARRPFPGSSIPAIASRRRASEMDTHQQFEAAMETITDALGDR